MKQPLIMMKKYLFIAFTILVIIIFLINKLLTVSTEHSLEITSTAPNTNQIQEPISITNTQAQLIKHELARMPKQASWAIERWNINNVDFELKEVSKETNNQAARHELKMVIPSNNKSKTHNMISLALKENLFSTVNIIKKNILYQTSIEIFTLNQVFWNFADLQVKERANNRVGRITSSHPNYLNYLNSDFPQLAPLIQEKHFRGNISYLGDEYYLYSADFEGLKETSELKSTTQMYLESLGQAVNNPESISKEKIRELLHEDLKYFTLIDTKTNLPAYYCDLLAMNKYIYPNDGIGKVNSLQIPTIIQENLEWYVENVLPEMELRAQKVKTDN